MNIPSTLPKIFDQDLRLAVKILQEEGCSEIFLFGSAAKGVVRAESDLDLAVRGCPRGRFFAVIGRLLVELDHSIDLVNLDATDAFAQRLKRGGELVQIA